MALRLVWLFLREKARGREILGLSAGHGVQNPLVQILRLDVLSVPVRCTRKLVDSGLKSFGEIWRAVAIPLVKRRSCPWGSHRFPDRKSTRLNSSHLGI